MAFNGSGTHIRVHDWTTDLSNTVPVTASRMDAEHDDISTALSNAICRDGQSTTTARIPFASGTSSAAGSASAVAYAQTNDTNTGLYFPSTDQWGLAAGGTATLTGAATKLTAEVPVDFDGAIAPTSSDGAALGSATQMWSDLFLASGAVINWNNGDATLTHAANALAFAGASSGYTFDAAVTFGGLLTVSAGGAAITGNSTVTGTLAVSSTLTASSGFTVSGGTLTLPAGSIETADIADSGVTTAKIADSNVTLAKLTGAAAAFQSQLLHVRDEKTQGTNAQTLSSGTWNTRTLNTTATNEISGASLSSNQVTLPAGTYYLEAYSAHSSGVGNTGVRWQNVTDATTTIKGLVTSGVNGWLSVRGRFTIASQKTFELQHVAQFSAEGGNENNNGTEVYAEALIWKVG